MPGESDTAKQAAELRDDLQRRKDYRRFLSYGVFTPVAYALVALTVIDSLTGRDSGLQAIKHLDFWTWLALAGYAGLVLLVNKTIKRPAYLRGVLVATPVVILIVAWLAYMIQG